MKKIIRQTGTVRYVPKADRELPESEQTVVSFRPLTQAERLTVFDSLTIAETKDGVTKSRSQSWRQSLELCAEYITNVENFPAGAAEPWPATEAQRLKYLEGFDEFVLLELGAAIRDSSAMPVTAGN